MTACPTLTLGLAAGLALLAACSPAPAPPRDDGNRVEVPALESTPGPVPTSAQAAASPPCLPAYPGTFAECEFLGRWRGVEGMYLLVSKADRPGRYRLEMQWDLDHKGAFDAEAVGEPAAPGLVFTREGKELTLRPTDGAATGLKYLAGKKDCLTVASGEGYCRD